jgi:hypothetical protein
MPGRPKPLQTEASELGHYGPRELAEEPDSSSDTLSMIEPLSDDSLAALGRLARYRAPPDLCTALFWTCTRYTER